MRQAALAQTSLCIHCANAVFRLGDEIPVVFVISNRGTTNFDYEARDGDRSGRMPEFELAGRWELEDTDERFGMSGTRNGKNFNDPRICDMAGEILAECFTNRYTFDFSASLKVRERQRIECLNVWRAAHGQPVLPIIPERSVHVSLAPATTVNTIGWEGIKPGAKFAGSVTAFKDQPLEPARIVDLLRRYVAAPEFQAGGLEFRAIKDEDFTGVRLIVKLLPGRTAVSSGVCEVAEHVTLGRKGLDGMSGAGGSDFYYQAGGWSGLADAMTTAIAGAPEMPFETAVQIRLADSK